MGTTDPRFPPSHPQIRGLTEESIAAKRAATELRDALAVSYSFKNICKIEYLGAFEKLTKLQLDNNFIPKIQNLDHLVHLETLDLSFNRITKIEGLDALTKLKDLSLFNNAIEKVEGMDAQVKTLEHLSLGNNKLESLKDAFAGLRPFHGLRILTLQGNAIHEDPDYKLYALGRLPWLKYLDHRRPRKEELDKARDLYVDEILEIEDRENDQRLKAEDAAKEEAKKQKIEASNLSGVPDLFERMLLEDPEYEKLRYIPNEENPELCGGLELFKDKYQQRCETFTELMDDQLERKKNERAEWQAVVDAELRKKDEEARVWVEEFETLKKHALRECDRSDAGVTPELELSLKDLLAKSEALYNKLMAQEQWTVIVIDDLVTNFDLQLGEIVDESKKHVMDYFEYARGLEETYFDGFNEAVGSVLMRLGQDELEEADETVKDFLGDKDRFMNSCQNHHDSHVNTVDTAEETMSKEEKRRHEAEVETLREWQQTRNRARISEMLAMRTRHREAIEEYLDTE